MGMFDSVWVACPSCAAMNEFQSKGGDCMLADYHLSDRPLDRDEAELFLLLQIADEAKTDQMFEGIMKEDGGWVLQAIQKRFSVSPVGADKKVMVAVLFIGQGVVGKCAEHVDEIVARAVKKNFGKVDWETFTKVIYPHGIPEFSKDGQS